jgi:hypothetical protein
MKLNKKLIKGMIFGFSSFIVLVAPTIVLFIINRDEWVTQGDSTKISLGVMLGLLYAIFVMRGALKEVNVKVATLLSMFTFLGIVWFLDSVIQDLFWVILSTIVGYIFYMIMSSIGEKHMREYKAYRDEKVRITARQEANEDLMGV